MTEDLETRLSSVLDADAERLPTLVTDVDSVIARGARRQARARVAGLGVTVAVLAGSIGATFGLTDVFGEPAATVAADGGFGAGTPGEASTEGNADDEDAGPEGVEPPPRSDGLVPTPGTAVAEADGDDAGGGADEEASSTEMPLESREVEMPIMTIEPWDPEDPTTSTTAPPTTTTTTGPTTTRPDPPDGGRRSTDDVIGSFADDEILFFSNNDDCAGIEGNQAHPDWIEGQPGSGRNADGTPTYGFAYNTGDSRIGEYRWAFEEQPVALSGDCVLTMGLDGVDDNKLAVRIFRRYDRNGGSLPADAYYSMWFYFPEHVSYEARGTIDGSTAYGFWNVFQIKNKVRQSDGGEESFSALSFNAARVAGEDDEMSFFLWSKTECGRDVEECDDAGEIPQTGATPRPIPIGQWVHVELHLLARADGAGRVEVWQDGVKIYDYTGQTERVGTLRRNWSVNSYGQLHQPGSHELYADDALISTRPVHPLLFE